MLTQSGKTNRRSSDILNEITVRSVAVVVLIVVEVVKVVVLVSVAAINLEDGALKP